MTKILLPLLAAVLAACAAPQASLSLCREKGLGTFEDGGVLIAQYCVPAHMDEGGTLLIPDHPDGERKLLKGPQ